MMARATSYFSRRPQPSVAPRSGGVSRCWRWTRGHRHSNWQSTVTHSDSLYTYQGGVRRSDSAAHWCVQAIAMETLTAERIKFMEYDAWLLTQGGGGGGVRAAPLARRFLTIPTHFPLNLHAS
jgi:hypothetical protein